MKYKNNTTEEIVQNTHSLDESFETPTLLTEILAHIGFYILMFLGYLSEALFPSKTSKEKNRKGYDFLINKFAYFYSRYVYRRGCDCFNYPVCGISGSEVILKDRITRDHGWTFEFTGSTTKCINMASYNYMGFAQTSDAGAEAAINAIYKYGVTSGATRLQYGSCDLHEELEKLTAEFLGVDDAIVFGMGFATSALNIPTIISPECLIISDEKNHASIIFGIRLSDARRKVFRHNDNEHLEQILRESIYNGQPNQPGNIYKPWKKIIIFVEGIYSVEGSIVNLPEIITLKKKYKAYLYIDEAHSIGAIGSRGGGVIDYFGCNPKDVDIIMGTFSKSFGSSGGYIAGNKDLISYLRKYSISSKHAWAMAPPIAAFAIEGLKTLMGKDGTNEGRERINSLAINTRYFRRRLEQMNLIVHGNKDSPMVPILVYFSSKMTCTIRALRKMKVTVTGMAYPGTPLTQCKIRTCLSASHTKEQLDYVLEAINDVANEIGLKYSRKPIDPRKIKYN